MQLMCFLVTYYNSLLFVLFLNNHRIRLVMFSNELRISVSKTSYKPLILCITTWHMPDTIRKCSNSKLWLFGIALCFIKLYFVCYRLKKRKKSVDLCRLLKTARAKNKELLKIFFCLPGVVRKLLTYTGTTYKNSAKLPNLLQVIFLHTHKKCQILKRGKCIIHEFFIS